VQLLVQLVQAQCSRTQAGADLRTPAPLGAECDQWALSYRARARDCPAARDRRQVAWRPLKHMDTHRNPTAGYQPGPQTGDHLAAAAGSHAEVGRLLAHLEQRLEELDRLHVWCDASSLRPHRAWSNLACPRATAWRP
jgi:hypothetical protein